MPTHAIISFLIKGFLFWWVLLTATTSKNPFSNRYTILPTRRDCLRDCSHSSAYVSPKPPSTLIDSSAFLNQYSQIASCMREVLEGFYISNRLFKTADFYSAERAIKGAVHGNIQRGFNKNLDTWHSFSLISSVKSQSWDKTYHFGWSHFKTGKFPILSYIVCSHRLQKFPYQGNSNEELALNEWDLCANEDQHWRLNASGETLDCSNKVVPTHSFYVLF